MKSLYRRLYQLSVLSFVMWGLAAPALAQSQGTPAGTQPTSYPFVTFGVDSFLQYSAELHEQDGYNAFDVTRGYLNIKAQLSEKVSFRFTPDVRPTTDANLDRNLALRLEYAALDVQVSDNVKVMFGQHETPWLTFEESVNRYRVIGPFFSERLGLIPGPTDLGASIKATRGRTEVHAGVYNGEGYGQAELDRYKAIDGRATFRPFDPETELGNVTISGFYQYGWYARDRPRNVAIAMGSYESTHVLATAQYLQATDNPFVAVDVQRKGLSFFGEGRQGPTGWAGVAGLDFFDPDADNESDSRRRLLFGGAHWSQVGGGRLGIVVTLEQHFQTSNSELLGRRLLAQTQVAF
ncbi:MAG TPA: porin [Vicinamibacterales bacterium]|nr:porin [Vicinamibacterales bacterium]